MRIGQSTPVPYFCIPGYCTVPHTDCWDGLDGLERRIFSHRKAVQRLSSPAQLPATHSSQVLTGTPRACLSCCRHPPGMGHPTNVISIPWAPPLEPPNLPHVGMKSVRDEQGPSLSLLFTVFMLNPSQWVNSETPFGLQLEQITQEK